MHFANRRTQLISFAVVIFIMNFILACATTSNHAAVKPVITAAEARQEINRRIVIGCKGGEGQDYWRGFCKAMVLTIRKNEQSYNICIPSTYRQMNDNELAFLLGAYLEKSNKTYAELDQPFIEGMQRLFPCIKGQPLK